MHRLLQIDELVLRICAHACSKADLVKLALLEKGFGSIALDVLWDDIPMKALLFLFPPDAVGSDEQGKKVGIWRPLFTADWTRFDWYAPRIRTIRRTAIASDVVAIDNILHFLTSCRPRLILFPNLLCLEWHNAQLHEMSCFSIFFASSLNSFKASTLSDTLGPRSVVIAACVYEALLRYLSALGQGLRKVEVPVPSAPIPSGYQTPWITILNRCTSLVDVSLVPSPTLLALLSTLPNLRTLTLLVKDWEQPKELEIDLDNIDVIFPTLETLVLKEVECLTDITAILTGANCFARHKISIHCFSRPTPEDVAAFFKVGLHPIISSELRVFNLHAGNAERLGIDDINPLTLDVLRPLLHCHYMEQFVFDTTLPLSLSDDDLHRISSAWPNISTMSLGKERNNFSRANKLPISICGLDYLTACTRLLSLELTIHVTEDDIKSSYISTGLSDCPLEVLDVCTSHVHGRSIAAIACFLLQRFPKLKVIRSSDGSDKDRAAWEEVLDTMGTIQRLLKHHRLEIPEAGYVST